ncbi:MAG: YiiX/YebB-like N1pC/P60 family cysteine hydrolase [Pseudomonadales bacterium]|nr:YiiX/YebB-like N1pC/P60 family cysteine hydrolase [Pseudomonadales bacterium]
MLKINRVLGGYLARYLSRPKKGYVRHDTVPVAEIMKVLQPGDIVLVDGNSRISTAIKYLTQSTWSHASLFVGPVGADPEVPSLVEADLNDGVILVPLSKYAAYNVRICRPVGLADEERQMLVSFVEERLGYRYDLKNIFDLMRYLIQNPWVPPRFRRRLISLGSSEPTKAICSTLIAQAYQSVNYPILPRRREERDDAGKIAYLYRHYSHFVPRDFDLSPYFRIVKPTLERNFDFRTFNWGADQEQAPE